jgi:hypothetical protein
MEQGMTTYADQVAELELLRDVVREAGQRNGWDPSHERASSWSTGELQGGQVNQVWAALNQAARSISQLAEVNEQLRGRNDRLAHSNAALMVDRDHGIDAASVQAQAANLWAAGMAERFDVPQEEWPEQAREQLADQASTSARLEREVERLGYLRTSVVVPLMAACSQAKEGFTGEQVEILLRQLRKANNRAMGH